MNVGAVGAVGNGAAAVYAAQSPYLNGVQRTPDAAQVVPAAVARTAPAVQTPAAVQTAPAEQTSPAPPPPFLNPAIVQIADQTAALSGDGGLLVQSYGAVALLTGPAAIAAVYGLPAKPAVPRSRRSCRRRAPRGSRPRLIVR